MPLKNKALKKRWVEALRSGEFKQGKHVLYNITRKGDHEFCCLGVLCHIELPEPWQGAENGIRGIECGVRMGPENDDTEFLTLPSWFRNKIGLTIEEETALTVMNDRGASFEEIAEHIEEQL